MLLQDYVKFNGNNYVKPKFEKFISFPSSACALVSQRVFLLKFSVNQEIYIVFNYSITFIESAVQFFVFLLQPKFTLYLTLFFPAFNCVYYGENISSEALNSYV